MLHSFQQFYSFFDVVHFVDEEAYLAFVLPEMTAVGIGLDIIDHLSEDVPLVEGIAVIWTEEEPSVTGLKDDALTSEVLAEAAKLYDAQQVFCLLWKRTEAVDEPATELRDVLVSFPVVQITVK